MSETDQKELETLRRMLATPPKPHQPADYVALDGALFVAAIKRKSSRSMVADLFRNASDYRADKAMERDVNLVCDQSSPAQ